MMAGYGYVLQGPANFIFLFIIFFCVSTFSQTYRAAHTEGEAMYHIQRIITKDDDNPHESFWEELWV